MRTTPIEQGRSVPGLHLCKVGALRKPALVSHLIWRCNSASRACRPSGGRKSSETRHLRHRRRRLLENSFARDAIDGFTLEIPSVERRVTGGEGPSNAVVFSSKSSRQDRKPAPLGMLQSRGLMPLIVRTHPTDALKRPGCCREGCEQLQSDLQIQPGRMSRRWQVM